MAGATHLVAASNNSNPSTTVSGTTGAAITAGDKVIVTLFIPNSNPTGLTVTIDGQSMTEVASARATRSNSTICTFYYDDAAGRASGKTVSASWTNTGTSNGGGSLLLASKATPTNAFVAGAPEKVSSNNGLSQAPSTGSSGTPASSTANYFAYAALGVLHNVVGQESPDNSYAAMTQAANTTRSLLLDAAWLEFTAAVAAKTETWTPSWGANKGWAAAILLFKETVPAAPTISVAPAVTGTETVGSTLTTDNGTWTGSPTGYTYQWKRDVGTSGSTWLSIAGATASTYVLANADIGSKIRCDVVATNANGSSDPASSNTTSVTIPAPASVTYRLVAGPTAQSDAQTHNITLDKPVLPGERLVAFIACSNANTIDGNGNQSDVGSITDSAGNVWAQDCEAFSDANILHSGQAFSALAAAGLPYGSTITMHVWGGTGAGAYHGQSPFWCIVALNSGDSRAMVLDKHDHQVDILTSHVAPSVTTALAAVVLGFHVQDGATAGGWWTPTAGFTEICDTADAATQGGESAYAISAEAQVVTSGYTGGAGGSTGGNKAITNLVVSYKPFGAGIPARPDQRSRVLLLR